MIFVFKALLRRGYMSEWLGKLMKYAKSKYEKYKKTKHLKETFATLAASSVECDLIL